MPIRKLAFIFAIISIALGSCSRPPSTAFPDPPVTPWPTSIPGNSFYVDGSRGSDSNPGSIDLPWQTIKKATETAQAGDAIYVRAGVYPTIFGGWVFQNSGTSTRQILLTNYPGEQAIFQISQSSHDFRAFRCWAAPMDPASWQTPKADFIRIIGSDVKPSLLSNGVTSSKGLVVLGVKGEQGMGIEAAGCSNWEVSGMDFIEVAYGIFTKKRNFETMIPASADNWYVHDNRVYNFYRESGMQFNGNYNLMENNEIYKVSDELDTPYGCQLLNLNGNNNIVRKNTLSRKGSVANCGGILLEWDLADANMIEQNTISDVPWALSIAGGDNNIFQNNILYVDNPDWLIVYNYDNSYTGWPCNEATADVSDLPPNNPAHPDYKYYYNPRNCLSYGNQILNNTIHSRIP